MDSTEKNLQIREDADIPVAKSKRNRINRIKIIIIMMILILFLLSMTLNLILIIKIFRIEKRLDKIYSYDQSVISYDL